MTKPGTPWSDMELNQLKEMAGHFPAAHISAQIGRGKDGVLKQIRALGLKSYASLPPKPRPVALRKPVGGMKPPQPVERPVVAPVKPTVLRKANVTHVSYPPLEWCETCHAPVSNWADHRARMGCRRTA